MKFQQAPASDIIVGHDLLPYTKQATSVQSFCGSIHLTSKFQRVSSVVFNIVQQKFVTELNIRERHFHTTVVTSDAFWWQGQWVFE